MVARKVVLRKKIAVSLDSKIVYDYQDILSFAICPCCKARLSWIINPNYQDDKFSVASCCGMQYYMVPEKVRVISVSEAEAKKIDKNYVENISAKEYGIEDEDFLKELAKM